MSEARRRQDRQALGWLAAAALVASWGVVRFAVFSEQVLPLTFVLPLLVCVWTRSRVMLLAMAATFAGMASVKMLVVLSPTDEVLWSYAATMVNIATGAAVVLLIMHLRERLEASLAEITEAKELIEVQNEELVTQNEELAQQSEELAEQGEELAQQSEELEAQNEELVAQAEELDALNHELAARSRLLSSLLDATRRQDDDHAVLERVCAAGLETMSDEAVLAAVCMADGDSLRVEAAVGPGGVPVPSGALLLAQRSFEQAILREGRTACLDDARLRPDLGLLRREGTDAYSSALCAPFSVGDKGRARGVLCLYAHQAGRWTEGQFELAGWLAEQCGRTLETLLLDERLRDSEERLNLALSAAGIGAWDYRLDTGEGAWNRENALLFGYAPDALPPRLDDVLARVHPDDLAAARGVFLAEPAAGQEDVTRDGEDGGSAEFRVLLPDGERWLHAAGRVDRDEPSGRLRSYGVVFDVTQRRLSEQAQLDAEAAKAAQAERTRLARDLHDSITQALFAAALKAEALTYDDGLPGSVERAADELRRLTRGAVAQMRSLLLELRDESLDEVPIEQLLRNVVEATEGRADVVVELSLTGDGPPPTALHTAIYRIAQEALNNVARHAKAKRASVSLDVQAGRVRLMVQDDGRGTSPDRLAPERLAAEHLGVRSMRERAAEVGAELRTISAPGEGMLLILDWCEQPAPVREDSLA